MRDVREIESPSVSKTGARKLFAGSLQLEEPNPRKAADEHVEDTERETTPTVLNCTVYFSLRKLVHRVCTLWSGA